MHSDVRSEQRRRLLCYCLALLGTGVALVLLLTWHLTRSRQEYEPEARVDLRSRPGGARTGSAPAAAGTADGAGKRQLRIAIAPVVSPEKSLGMYQHLVDYLGRRTGREAVFIQRSSYSQINDLVRLGRCHLAFVCTYAYVLGRREFGMKLLAIPRMRGKTTYQSLIVVPAASSAQGLLDLRGKRFASADVMSTSGWLYPMSEIGRSGGEPDHFFSRHVISGSHDRSVYAVLTGMVDGAAVDSLVYEQMLQEQPGRLRGVKIIERSPPFGMPPVVTPSTIATALAAQLRRVLLGMHRDARGMAILQALRVDRFEPARDQDYQSVRRLVQTWEGRR